MAINKVVYGATTLVDLTDSTVTPETLALGQVAYNAAGERIVGTMIPFADIETEGNWKYRIYEDSTWEAWYMATGQTFNIAYSSGNFYRSNASNYTLPTALQSGVVQNAQAQVMHSGFPVFGSLSTLNPIGVSALSGANRGSNSNYTVVIYAFGTL